MGWALLALLAACAVPFLILLGGQEGVHEARAEAQVASVCAMESPVAES